MREKDASRLSRRSDRLEELRVARLMKRVVAKPKANGGVRRGGTGWTLWDSEHVRIASSRPAERQLDDIDLPSLRTPASRQALPAMACGTVTDSYVCLTALSTPPPSHLSTWCAPVRPTSPLPPADRSFPQPVPFEALIPFGASRARLCAGDIAQKLTTPPSRACPDNTGLLTVMFAVTGTGFSAVRRIQNDGKVSHSAFFHS